MKFPRKVSHFRSLKFAPFAILSFFIFTNVTGIMFSHVLAPVAAASPAELQIPADVPTSGDKDLDRIIFEVGEREGVDPRFIHAVIWQESRYDVSARSHAGAQGLMQLMPGTAKRFGCEDPNDPQSNIEAGTKYLGWLLKRFSGNVELALAGYNAGEGAVDKYNGIPPYNETRNYVKIISQRYGKTYLAVQSPQYQADAD
ncbi:MAG TPA: lytic transglycosylase domain-containing protein [Pyrinomonadaceae bacterium]|jgi:soluble lytic murein transglycosylase-like protein|nr:lytic transglycosylase domain-containing protein [Pyrinomonadaceae bacterium]